MEENTLELKDLLCEYTTATKLKKIGFPMLYNPFEFIINPLRIRPVLLCEAQQFLREAKRVEVNAFWDNSEGKWLGYAQFMDYPDLSGSYPFKAKFETHQQALDNAISETIKLLQDENFIQTP